MTSPNGVAGALPILRFSVVPRSVPFEIERTDPSGDPNLPPIVVTLRAWDRRLPHPASIDIAVEAAIDVFREAAYQESQRIAEAPGAEQRMPLEAATNALHADILGAVIEGGGEHEGLTPAEIDVLVSDAGPWEAILVALGWWKRVEAEPETPPALEDEADPEAEGEGLATTTEGSSRSSVVSTDRIRGAA